MGQPTLTKSKSKLGLRLGLTRSKPIQPEPYSSSLSPVISSPPRSSSLAAPTSNSRPLDISTSTNTSGTSRPDSRSLFMYDTSTTTSPPFDQEPSPPVQDFRSIPLDTISYTSLSPASVAFDSLAIQPNPSSQHQLFYNRHQEAYPTSPYSDNEEEVDFEEYHSHPEQSKVRRPTHIREPSNDAVVEYEFDNSQESGEYRPSLDKYPAIKEATKVYKDVLSLLDEQLEERFRWIEEVGFGNWGCVWACQPRFFRHGRQDINITKEELSLMKLGNAAAENSGYAGGGLVAVKCVRRVKDACTAARVLALWGEMKIIRYLKAEPHPSIIQFEAFVITPSYALVIMPYLPQIIGVELSPEVAIPYFRQLASAIGYLHDRGVTHNDIKVSNILLSHSDIPVLVDFGFAHRWDLKAENAFFSEISWGTPEYLDPLRAMGECHDERASDVWSLGITFFEILTGRTPFEINYQEIFDTPEQNLVYYRRTVEGTWLGEWVIPRDVERLIRAMLNPEPAYRLTAMQVYHHQSLQPSSPEVMITPHFVREAATFEEPPLPVLNKGKSKGSDGEKKKRKKRKDLNPSQSGRITPALGESIKQHTSAPRVKKNGKGKEGKENRDGRETPSPKREKVVIKGMMVESPIKGIEDDITPTKINRPAQSLKMKEMAVTEKTLISRPSHVHLRDVVKTTSVLTNRSSNLVPRSDLNSTRASIISSLKTNSKQNFAPPRTLSHRTSNLSVLSHYTTSTVGAKTKEEARFKAMQSLEGKRVEGLEGRKKKEVIDVLSNISRPAPEPPSSSMGTVIESEKKKEQDAQRRSLGLQKQLEGVVEERPSVEVEIVSHSDDKARESGHSEVAFRSVSKSARGQLQTQSAIGSPPRKRLAKPADSAIHGSPVRNQQSGEGPPILAFPQAARESGLGSLKDRILSTDQEHAARFRQLSGDLIPAQFPPSTSAGKIGTAPSKSSPLVTEPATQPDTQAIESTLGHRKSTEALAIDSRLDKISEWVKNVELIVDQARRAIAEGRELPLPLLTLPDPESIIAAALASASNSSANTLPAVPIEAEKVEESVEKNDKVEEMKRFGMSPEKALPEHLRTSSTQVEPATPPKWMTYAEAEERIRQANKWMEITGDGPGIKRLSGKRERPSVVNVLKIFGEKEKIGRSNTPEPSLIPLKPPAPLLRATPSTPLLQSSFSNSTSQTQRIPARKSESNLRAFHTLPTSAANHVSFADVIESAFSDDDDDLATPTSARSPRRLYEKFLDTTPGVVRQGEGWGSLSSGKALAKPSSMASLRERARMLLSGGEKERQNGINANERLAEIANGYRNDRERRDSKQLDHQDVVKMGRPATPGAGSVLTMTSGVNGGQQRGWGLFKGFKGKKKAQA